MNSRRRAFLRSLAGLPVASWAARAGLGAFEGEVAFEFPGVRAASTGPVRIASIELVRTSVGHFVRSRSIDGAEGVALCSERVGYLIPILTDRVAPYFVGKDARELERLIDGVYVHESNYKLAGMPFWICVAWVELSLLDLLGKIAEKSAGALLGPVLRTEIPVYLSSLRRDTTPEREVEWIAPRLEATGARAVKIKVGGRMSRNADAAPGRTEKLVALARDTFGPDVALMADANGSYDAARGIEVGRRLQDLGYAFFEEPCPFEELEETKRVADALDMTVAGGEQDASLPRFDWMARNRVVDLLQPDVTYVGGLTRALRVARIAAAAGLKITPHSPSTGAGAVPMLQFASVAPNIGPHQEYRGEAVKPETWHAATIEVRGGTVAVPKGPGLGLDIDPTVFEKASVIGRA